MFSALLAMLLSVSMFFGLSVCTFSAILATLLSVSMFFGLNINMFFGLSATLLSAIPKQIISTLWHEGVPDIDNIELLIQQMTGE